jgi:sulfoxide reductase heme-binding subunit YedZ
VSRAVLLGAAPATNARALWYLARASGLVAMVLLSATVVLGIVSSVGWASARWPRFASQALHRNLSLLCVALIGIHVASIVGDGYVPISLADAVIPFRSPYRTLWVGLGACAFDLLLAVVLTSALRRHLGARAWRSVHWLAYACWPVALVHGLGSGTDTRLGLVELLYVACAGAVGVAALWRLVVAARSPLLSTVAGRPSQRDLKPRPR